MDSSKLKKDKINTTTDSIKASNRPDGVDVWLRILHINDVYELDHFAAFKSLVDSKKAEGADRVLVILAGDFLGPSLLSSLDHGSSMVDCLNAIGITHVCFGNHECDVPIPALAKRIEQAKFIWLNSNLQDLNARIGVQTPEYDIVTTIGVPAPENGEVIEKRVALLGLLTNDPALYRPGSFANAKFEPVIPTAERYANQLLLKKDFTQDEKKQESTTLPVDLIIPFTHQSMEDDRAFAKYFIDHDREDMRSCFPLILGGHDHVPFDETITSSISSSSSSCRILKMGYDAINTGMVDIFWKRSTDGSPCVEITSTMIPTASFPPDPDVAARVQSHKALLKQLSEARLFRIPHWTDPHRRRFSALISLHTMGHGPGISADDGNGSEGFSTANNRSGPSTGTTALATMLRMGMRCCDVALLNAGSVRGNRIYPPDQVYFTYSDLKAEMPFLTAMTITAMPGSVLQATVAHSRRFLGISASGGLLHFCNNVVYDDETKRIETIKGQPFEEDKIYSVTHPAEFLDGIDNHEPLLEWAALQRQKHEEEQSMGLHRAMTRERHCLLHSEAARPAKLVIVELFSALLWLQLGTFDQLDVNGDGVITRDEVKQKYAQMFNLPTRSEDEEEEVTDLMVDNVWSVADMNGTGIISPLEVICVNFIAMDLVHPVTNAQEYHRILKEIVAHVLNEPSHSSNVQIMMDRVHRKLRNWRLRNGLSSPEEEEDLEFGGGGSRRQLKLLGDLRRQSLLK